MGRKESNRTNKNKKSNLLLSSAEMFKKPFLTNIVDPDQGVALFEKVKQCLETEIHHNMMIFYLCLQYLTIGGTTIAYLPI